MLYRTIKSCLLLVALLTGLSGFSQSWPLVLQMENGDQVKIYQPQPEQFSNNQLLFQSAVALEKKGADMPVFGTLWANAQTQAAGNAVQELRSLSITGIRFPAEIDETATRQISDFIEAALPAAHASLSTNDLQASLKINQEKKELDNQFVNTAPRLYYRNKPSMLVQIDGEPRFQTNSEWGLDAVVNSPNTILRYNGKYYIYGGKHWYEAAVVTGPYHYEPYPPAALGKVESSLQSKEATQQDDNREYNSDFTENADKPVSEVIVSTEPAELVQSNGEASFTPVENTGLLYVENSPNDIFMDIASQQYYVLISGRWLRSNSLYSNWTYVSADALPADFANIPAGSSKDNVLASVAGTPAAKNALMDAQLPQTAKVDRNATPNAVQYDGTPEFQKISGTRLSYAVNTSSTVIKYKSRYFLVENGVWFEAGAPSGPWAVSTERPDEVELIPPSYPVYNVKYVYVYDYTPGYVYMGYTPGYLNTFVYGPTVVYGTGWYYRPWYGAYYFPRPYTWGFNMHYNPWYGWSIGFNFSAGWFNYGWGYSPWNYWYGGWWGPSVYRPAYCAPYYRNYGYYGYRNNHFYVSNRGRYGGYGNGYGYSRPAPNIYSRRPNIVTHDVNRYGYANRPNRRPAGMDNGRPGNNGRPGSGRPDNGRPSGNGRYDNNRPAPGRTNPGYTNRPDLNPRDGVNRPNPGYSGGRPGRANNTGVGARPVPQAENTPVRPQPQRVGTSRPQPQRAESRPEPQRVESRSQPQTRPSADRPGAERPAVDRPASPDRRVSPQRAEPPRQMETPRQVSPQRQSAPQVQQRQSAPAPRVESRGSVGRPSGGGGGGRPDRRGH